MVGVGCSNEDEARVSDGSEESRYAVDLNKPLVFQVVLYEMVSFFFVIVLI